ncbi:MAG: hypothetical protein ACTTKL_01520 [Treponema sp.]
MQFTASKTPSADNTCLLEIRIISDEIKLSAGRTGFYAYSEHGLALVIDCAYKGFANGGKLSIALLTKPENLERDKKFGALEITVDQTARKQNPLFKPENAPLHKTPSTADNVRLLEIRIISDEIKLPAGRTGFTHARSTKLRLPLTTPIKDLQTEEN